MSPARLSSGLAGMLRSLRYRNYRLFFSGQLVSLVGTWMQMVALSWLVYAKTESPFLLGLVGFSSQIPSFLVAPLAGVWIDRLDRRNVLVATQTLLMLQAFALAALTFSHRITIHQILALSVLSGIVSAFDMPARQTFVVEMIEDKQDLGNAIALNSSMFNGARLIGPAVAGVLVATVGEAWCFLLNGISFLAVIGALMAMRVVARRQTRPDKHILHEMYEGFVYAFGFAPIRAILLLLSMVSLLGMSYAVLMPVFAKTILGGDAQTLGLLMSAVGVGALMGAAYLAARKTVLGLGRILVVGTTVFGFSLIGLSMSARLWISLAMLVVAGFGMMVQMAASNTLLQTIVDENKRGRVMSFYVMSFMGMAPFGSLLAGYMARVIGPQITVSISGLCCLVGAAVFALRLPMLRERTRPIYIRLGILPNMPGAIQATPGTMGSPDDENGNADSSRQDHF